MLTVEQLVKNFRELDPSHKREWVERRRAMRVHTQGELPTELLKRRRPNEPEDVYKYRLEIYEPITVKGINKAKDITARIFSSAQFTWSVPEGIEAELGKPIFEGKDFFKFMFSDCFDAMIDDANGYLAWLPDFENLQQNATNVARPYIVTSDRIKWVEKDLFCFKAEDQIAVQQGEKVKLVDKFWCITPDFIHLIHENYSGTTFSIAQSWANITGEVTACILGGNSDGKDLLKSFFWAYLPFANKAIRQDSDLDATMVTSAFPTRVEMVEDCDAAGCVSGLYFDSELHEKLPCKSCSGTGKKATSSPYGVYQFLPKTVMEQDSYGGGFAPLSYVAPPTDIIKLQQDYVQSLLQQAEDALHLQTVDEAQSGTAKQIDREGQYSLLSKISTNIFDGYMYYSLRWLVKYYSSTPEYQNFEVELSQPVSFTIRTEADLTDELKALNEAKAPEVFKRNVINDINKKRFSGDSYAHKQSQVIELLDPFITYSTQDKIDLYNAGIISRAKFLRSTYAINALDAVIAARGKEVLFDEIQNVLALANAELDNIVNGELNTQAVQVPAVDTNFNV